MRRGASPIRLGRMVVGLRVCPDGGDAIDAVVDLLRLADELGIEFWVNCGWGVDATLGRQTRDHRDLDLLIERRHEAEFADALRQRGFAPRDDPDAQPWSYVLTNSDGHEVDPHVLERLPNGDWAYGVEDRG